MRLGLGPIRKKKGKMAVLLVAVLALISLIIWQINLQSSKKSHISVFGKNSANISKLPKDQQLSASLVNSANAFLSAKNYKLAAEDCNTAAANMYFAKDYKKTIDILDSCFSRIPQDNFQWSAFATRAYAAQAVNDKKSATKYLTIAIQKYQQDPNNPPETLNTMKKSLEDLSK